MVQTALAAALGALHAPQKICVVWLLKLGLQRPLLCARQAALAAKHGLTPECGRAFTCVRLNTKKGDELPVNASHMSHVNQRGPHWTNPPGDKQMTSYDQQMHPLLSRPRIGACFSTFDREPKLSLDPLQTAPGKWTADEAVLVNNLYSTGTALDPWRCACAISDKWHVVLVLYMPCAKTQQCNSEPETPVTLGAMALTVCALHLCSITTSTATYEKDRQCF